MKRKPKRWTDADVEKVKQEWFKIGQREGKAGLQRQLRELLGLEDNKAWVPAWIPGSERDRK